LKTELESTLKSHKDNFEGLDKLSAKEKMSHDIKMMTEGIRKLSDKEISECKAQLKAIEPFSSVMVADLG